MVANGVSDSVNGPQASCSPLSLENINPKVVQAQYAVRGEIVIRAKELEDKLHDGEKLPFDKVLYCNIGNPQQLGQHPVTFYRQVLALCDYPELMDNAQAQNIFPSDVIARAKKYLAAIPGGTGAYSDSRGAMVLRQDIAKGIEERDGYPCDPDNLFLTDGASQGVHSMMRLLLRNEKDCILTPIPQYPLYSATLTLYGGELLPYYLHEETGWSLDINELREQTYKARSEGKSVRGLVVINPGNPTGQILSYENQVDVVKFCKEEGIALLADEVYQANIYRPDKAFTSFKKVLCDLKEKEVTLASMMSISKGFYGECGRRGGYTELVNLDPKVLAEVYKLASINLCSNVNGQICMALVMNPPKEGDPSYKLYAEERNELLASLKRRAVKLHKTLSALQGVTCTEPEGALYAMPHIRLPQGAIEAAKKVGKAPDFFYCMQLLEETGIVTVPGSGFKQEEGTYHFRTTFLIPEPETDEVAERLVKFHNSFLAKYGEPEQ
ncbi:g1802 [Coccomyxa elongata]